MQKTVIILLVVSAVVTTVFANGGSRCPGTVCAAGPPGHKCHPKYERLNKCCPVWYCRDAFGAITTHYGMSSASGGAVVQSVSSSVGGQPGGNLLQGLQSMFQNMFGRRK